MTPYKVLNGMKPDISNLCIWGQKVWVHDDKGTKLDGRAKEGYRVGIDDESKAHQIYWPGKRSVSVERSVKSTPEEVHVLLEGKDMDFEKQEELGKEDKWPISSKPVEEQPIPEVEHEAPPLSDNEGGQPKHIQKPSAYVRQVQEGEGTATGLSRGHALLCGLQIIPEANEEAQEDANLVEVEWGMATVMDSVEFLNPTYEEARKCSNWPKWQDAIKAELASLKVNKTRTVVECPKDVNVVGCKWVLQMKKNAAGEVEKYKARLVARGFTQIYSVDFYETYAPVAQLSSLQLLLAMANSRNGWPVDSFNFDSAYLNLVLSDDEVIYLEQPAEYVKGNSKEHVFHSQKALYRSKL